jgi:hypothetical protein
MQLTLVFEILLLVAILAGVFVGWNVGTKEDPALQNRGQAPINDEIGA